MFLVRKALRILRLPYTKTNDMAEESTTTTTTTTTITPSPTTSHFTPLIPDVLDLKSVLWQKGLPVELIDSVIDFAEYWPRLATEFEHTIAVGNYGKIVYLQSQPLPGLFVPESSEEGGTGRGLVVGGLDAGKLKLVRKLVFKTWSKDQGWSSNAGRGTYSGSHSWFEVFAERPLSISAVQNAAQLSDPVDIDNEAKLQESQSSDGEPAWETVTVSSTAKREDGPGDVVVKKEAWELQKNVHAADMFKEHEIIWTWTDNDGGVAEDDGASGAGKGGEFVRCLRSGYRIRVVARAQYPGWVNHVEKVKLEIFYAV